MSRVIYGLHPVKEALAARKREISAIYTDDEDIERRARTASVLCERRTKEELDALCGPGARHQGAVALVGEYPYVTPADLLQGEKPLLLALDGITDPQNFGSLVRSAHVLGASGLLVPKDRAAQVTPAVVRASAGATEHMRIALVTNLVRALEELKEEGVWIVGAVASDEGRPPWEIDLRESCAIVVGSEGAGIRRLVQRVCDFHVRIPMAGQVASLNAAVAGAVLLYEAARQRGRAA